MSYEQLVKIGVPPGMPPLEAARMLNLDLELMVFRQRREPGGSILRLPRGWWKTDDAGSDTPPGEIPMGARRRRRSLTAVAADD
jgi:hypothetical protein